MLHFKLRAMYYVQTSCGNCGYMETEELFDLDEVSPHINTCLKNACAYCKNKKEE